MLDVLNDGDKEEACKLLEAMRDLGIAREKQATKAIGYTCATTSSNASAPVIAAAMIDRQGARLLFQVVSKCYERRSLIVTTNLEFSRWGSVLTDDQMAAAMIDRIIHYGHLIVFEGPTKRMEASPMANKH